MWRLTELYDLIVRLSKGAFWLLLMPALIWAIA